VLKLLIVSGLLTATDGSSWVRLATGESMISYRDGVGPRALFFDARACALPRRTSSR
jgi:hypothetical protein